MDRGRKTLLDHVSFPVGEKCLLAVVGPERRRQVDAPQRADRAPPRRPGHRPLRRPRPLPRLRGAAPAHRPRTAGRHPALAADCAPGAGYAAELRFPAGHREGRAPGPGGRGGARTRPRAAGRAAHPQPVGRPAQAGQRGPGAADEAVAALPRRADLRARPRHGPLGHAYAPRPRRRRPYGHRRHAQRAQPGCVRPAAGARARRPDRLLRAAGRRPRLLRLRAVAGGVRGLRERPGPGLGGDVPRVPLPPAVHRRTPRRSRNCRRPRPRASSRRRRRRRAGGRSCGPWCGGMRPR